MLALIRFPRGFSYAVADPWELRAAGSVRSRARSLGAAVARAVRREKPTLVVTDDAEILRHARRTARRFGIEATDETLPKLPPSIGKDLYPELPMRAPSPSLSRAARLAIAAVLYAEAPSRRYATCRQRPPEHAA